MSFDRQLDDSAGDSVRNESALCQEPRAYSSEQSTQDPLWDTEVFKTDAVILACPNSCVLDAISVFYLTTAVYYMGLLRYLNIAQKRIGK